MSICVIMSPPMRSVAHLGIRDVFLVAGIDLVYLVTVAAFRSWWWRFVTGLACVSVRKRFPHAHFGGLGQVKLISI